MQEIDPIIQMEPGEDPVADDIDDPEFDDRFEGADEMERPVPS